MLTEKTLQATIEDQRASLLATHTKRRGFLARVLGLGAGALAWTASEKSSEAQIMPVPGVNDAAILNFSLNFEYLDSELYTHGVYGVGIDQQGIPIDGIGTPGPTITKPNPTVNFATPLLRQFFIELARDEQAHVKTVRSGLASLNAMPIAKPEIDLLGSFNTAGQMTGMAPLNPYANENNFLLGAYILEDVCVMALHGAAPLIVSKAILNSAAGLLGVESYQAGAIRALLSQMPAMRAATQAISVVRATASHNNDDFGVAQGPLGFGPTGATSIVLADRNALAFARNFRQVLNIAYLNPNNPAAGGFFPLGVNGPIRG